MCLRHVDILHILTQRALQAQSVPVRDGGIRFLYNERMSPSTKEDIAKEDVAD